MKRKPLIYVVILNWESANLTIDCVSSILGGNYLNVKILVIDNGSTDNSVDHILQRFPCIEIIKNDTNLGYAEGNNVGIKHALKAGADFILILNNDTVIHAEMINKLLECFEISETVGMVGPKMYCFSPPNKLFAAGSWIDWNNGSLIHKGIFQYPQSVEDIDCIAKPDFIIGCAFLVKSKIFETVGLFNPDYYLNFEDVELGWKIKQAGYEVVYQPEAVIWHKVSATLGIASPANTYYMTRNALLFFSRWGKFSAQQKIIVRTIRTNLAWRLKPHYKEKIYRYKEQANWLAIRDYFLGRFGAMGEDVRKICYPKEVI